MERRRWEVEKSIRVQIELNALHVGETRWSVILTLVVACCRSMVFWMPIGVIRGH